MLRKIEVDSAKRSLPIRYKILLAGVLLAVLVFAAWQPVKNRINSTAPEIEKEVSTELNETSPADEQPNTDDTGNTESSESDSDDSTHPSTDELANDSVNEYTLTSGDTLAKVLEAQGIGFKEVFALTKKYPILEKELKPGQIISWTTNEEGHLQNLTWLRNRKETRLYDLTEEDGFVETVEMAQGEWREMTVNGEIGQDGNATLCGSAIAAGLTTRECHNAARYLQYQVNLNALRIGDKFAMLLEREFVNNEHTASRLLAAKITHRKRERYIVYFEKYSAYYDDEGKPLTDGFLRVPTSSDKKFRISSNFNPRRLHPVTKRVAPHNGVDFAMPIGTPIVAAGDGEVVISRFSATAGNYVALKHGKQYSTRYMHMSKLSVRVGQIVKRGDLLGYSGNTGRSTGPHLHYEFLVDNKHVDPMKMTLPRSEGLKDADLKEFMTYTDGLKVKFVESYEAYQAEKIRKAEEKKKYEWIWIAEGALKELISSETPEESTTPEGQSSTPEQSETTEKSATTEETSAQEKSSEPPVVTLTEVENVVPPSA